MRNILCLLLLTAWRHSASKPTVAPASSPAPGESSSERFDEKVRADFFDGMRGDTAAMERAMKVCDETLAKNPKHAEAMVWHGAGVVAPDGMRVALANGTELAVARAGQVAQGAARPRVTQDIDVRRRQRRAFVRAATTRNP